MTLLPSQSELEQEGQLIEVLRKSIVLDKWEMSKRWYFELLKFVKNQQQYHLRTAWLTVTELWKSWSAPFIPSK